jgi:hypothetical protein
MVIVPATAWLVNEKVTMLEVPSVAVTCTVPGAEPNVTFALICPLDPDVLTIFESVAEPCVTFQVTAPPETGCPQLSVIVATSGKLAAAPAFPVWLLPDTMERFCPAPRVTTRFPL